MKTGARQFWTDIINQVFAAQTDRTLTRLADLFTARTGEVFVLELARRKP